jgi:hypothetical protein
MKRRLTRALNRADRAATKPPVKSKYAAKRERQFATRDVSDNQKKD